MTKEIHLWQVAESRLRPVSDGRLDLESRLEQWLTADITLVGERLLVIGCQVPTDFGGYIDILCLDDAGDSVIVELKRDKTPREITAQVLDYASWVADLSADRITEIAERHLQESLDAAFRSIFSSEPPEVVNANHRLLIVGSVIDDASERIIQYLSNRYGVSINAVTFQYFKLDDGTELLGRVHLLEPDRVVQNASEKGNTKRRGSLSLEELEAEADRNGIGELYRRAVDAFRPHFRSIQTTRSSLRLAADFGDRTGALLNLIPTQADQGRLPFQLYTFRAAQLLGLPVDTVVRALPSDKRPWQYQPGDDRWWHGHAGTFQTPADWERLIQLLDANRQGPAAPAAG